MFLKSLSMKGFKSFADPTVLEFEPGITVVVGPNGSGKSNVVDAVTWVLGAQGPRSLRSQKMEDVIFAGTSTRPVLGRAEVSLTIDNTSGRLPVDMAEVTITRILFRSGDSEYAINGSPCRLLDIQDLLSDSGVGRQQHMIVGQGQLDTVLNARPEDRRSIIEEAAGVLKHRRRRERAERRLAATADNLERLGDLVREVRRQIRPLERQAAAARSHTVLAAELRALRLHLAGSELEELERRRQVAADGLGRLSVEQGQLEVALARLDEAASATAADLSSRREEDLAAALGRAQGLVERTRGTSGVLRERTRALDAAFDAAADVDVVSSLEAEGAQLAGELTSAEEAADDLGPERRALSVAEEDLLDAEAQHVERWGARMAEPAHDAIPAGPEEALAVARGRLELLEQSVEQGREQLASLDQRSAVLAEGAVALASLGSVLAEEGARLEGQGDRLRDEAAVADRATTEAERRVDELQAVVDTAEQARHRSGARAEALARALHELQGAGGRELLDGVDGVVGSLVDLVEIDPGWEAAFEAAAGAAVAAVVVEGREAAHGALARLRRQGVTGAVLAARAGIAPGGANPLLDEDGGPPDLPPDLPPGVEPLRPHIRSRHMPQYPGLAGILDALVGRAVRIGGWERAIDLSLDRPELVVVTADGDRFARSGWRVRSGGGVVTAAAVEAAERRAVEASTEADRQDAALRLAREHLDSARQAALAAARALDRHDSATAASAADRSRNADEMGRLEAQLADGGRFRREAQARVDADAGALAALEQAIPDLEQRAALEVTQAAERGEAQRVLDDRRRQVAAMRQDLDVRAAGRAERRRVLAERLAEVERRLQGHADERQEAAARRHRLEAEGLVLRRLGELVDGAQARVEGMLDELRHDYRGQVEAVRAGGERLEVLRRDRTTTERRLGELRDRTRLLDLEAAEVSLRTDTLLESVRRDLGCEPDDIVGAPGPDVPEGVGVAEHAAALADRLAALGPVNPLALEELSVLEARHRELDAQVNDVRSGRRELQEVVRALDQEIMGTFAAAAADVNEHFSTLVAMLFPGGTGRLALTDPEDLLATGVEIEVRPAGRNVRRVSLLSGGERSLAALAFLFAVFRSRPSPFYLMDEVEAALDDVNLHRFLGLVREFREEAQLIIVSHQKRTMEMGDALYGVTMAPGGSSQVVSQKVLRQPEAAAS